MILTKRNRTSTNDIGYGLYLYFIGLSYRNTAIALSRFKKRSHVSIWKWMMHKYKPEKIFYNRMKISKFIVGGDETQIKVGKDYFWLWVVDIIKPKDKDILLHIHISAAERNMFIAEHFLRSLVKKYGRYPVSHYQSKIILIIFSILKVLRKGLKEL